MQPRRYLTVGLLHIRGFEYDGMDIDVPLEEHLVEAARETPRWRVMLSPARDRSGSRKARTRRRFCNRFRLSSGVFLV